MESGPVLISTDEAHPAERPRMERFGRYYLLERIGKGGMAEVFRAVTQGAEGFRRTFVVKRIVHEKASSPSFIRMFCDEARISALLHHPNVVQVYDFGHVNGSYFLAMEYLAGRDLSSVNRVLRASNLAVPPSLAAFIAQQVALGLHYAHALHDSSGRSLGIVHRDVTPSNIMLLHAGGVKILDFGIAKASSLAEAGESERGIVKGKFAYLSPEQGRGDPIDGRSDLFALGVTLWEMLTGKRLFSGASDFETLRNVLGRPVAPPSIVRAGVPAELDRVVMRALERDRDRRYATGEEIANDLDQFLRDARYESQSLRRFLGELFGDESSSLSLDVPELPPDEEAAVPAAPQARDPSLQLDITESTPPPLVAPAWWRRRPSIVAAAVLGVAALAVGVGLGASRHGRAPAAPPSPPALAPAPTAAAVAPQPPLPEPAAAPPAAAIVVAPPPPETEAPVKLRSKAKHAHRHDLGDSVTIDPF
jgi:serine/threonine protein kinase